MPTIDFDDFMEAVPNSIKGDGHEKFPPNCYVTDSNGVRHLHPLYTILGLADLMIKYSKAFNSSFDRVCVLEAAIEKLQKALDMEKLNLPEVLRD